jgi:hypothetical protein
MVIQQSMARKFTPTYYHASDTFPLANHSDFFNTHGSIHQVIHKISGISETIATAVEEQSATTNEMSRNVSEAAIAAGEISQTIGGVSRAAELASAGAAESQRAVEELADMSRQLNCLVTQFKIDIHEVAASGARGRPQSLAAAASK